MKTLFIALLLVSTSVFALDSFYNFSDSYVPDTNFQEQHRQELERKAEQRRQELIEGARHEQQMRQLEGLKYKGTDPFGRPLR